MSRPGLFSTNENKTKAIDISPGARRASLTRDPLVSVSKLSDFVYLFNDYVNNRIHAAKGQLELLYKNHLTQDAQSESLFTARSVFIELQEKLGIILTERKDLPRGMWKLLKRITCDLESALLQLESISLENLSSQEKLLETIIRDLDTLPTSLQLDQSPAGPPQPLVRARRNSAAPLSSSPTQGSKIKYEPLNLRVLIVEDNVVSWKVLARVLDLMGCAYSIAKNGQEAVDFFPREGARKRFDLVLMDINMPVRNGLEATEEIIGRYPETTIIGLSADPDPRESEVAETKRIGNLMRDFLQKPCAPQKIYDTLKHYMKSDFQEEIEGHVEALEGGILAFQVSSLKKEGAPSVSADHEETSRLKS